MIFILPAVEGLMGKLNTILDHQCHKPSSRRRPFKVVGCRYRWQPSPTLWAALAWTTTSGRRRLNPDESNHSNEQHGTPTVATSCRPIQNALGLSDYIQLLGDHHWLLALTPAFSTAAILGVTPAFSVPPLNNNILIHKHSIFYSKAILQLLGK